MESLLVLIRGQNLGFIGFRHGLFVPELEGRTAMPSCHLIRVSVQDSRFSLRRRIVNTHHLRSGWDIPNSGVYRKPAVSIVRTYGTLYVWFTFGYQ
jgi:hypothetical protein